MMPMVYIWTRIASTDPVFCFDGSHGHTIGGGNYWVEGYRQMVTRAKNKARQRKADIILTSEDHAEPYIDVFDGLLTCNSTKIAPDLIPMYHYVYSDYVITYGRYAYFEGLSVIMQNAQMFIWGAQLNWSYAKTMDLGTPEVEYLKTLCNALAKDSVKKFLVYGEMVRPPKLDGDNPQIAAVLSEGGRETAMPAVSHSAWKADDGTVGLVFTNIDTIAHVVSYKVNVRDFQLDSTKKYNIEVLAGESAGKKEACKFSVARTAKLPARSVLVLDISPEL